MSNPIGWCDETWNPVTGCTKVSEGCRHCYAERMAMRRMAPEWRGDRKWTDVRCHPERLEQPSHWRKHRRVFVGSMTDIFHPDVPDWFIGEVLNVCVSAPQHEYIILTKRPARMRELVRCQSLEQIMFGVSVEDQATADERIPLLLQTPAARRGISIEPMIGPVDLGGWYLSDRCGGVYPFPNLEPEYRTKRVDLLDVVILGGETGPGARPMHPDWVRSVRDQCVEAGVQFWFKGWGEFAPGRFDWQHFAKGRAGEVVSYTVACSTNRREIGRRSWWAMRSEPDETQEMVRVGRKAAGHLLDGVEWHHWPGGGA